MRRSMLFLPGNTPNIIVNGEILGADAVILDLEDAVAPTEKDSARILVRNAIGRMGFGKCEVIVRINSIDTPFWRKDLDEIIPVRPSLIMPPKTGCAEDVRAVDAEEGVTIELRVDPDDMGKVIGKQGRIAKAIRTVVKGASSRSEKPVFVEIVE